MVPHIPYCKKVNGKCVSEGTTQSFYPWHTMTEVFYTKDQTSYLICNEMESYECSNQYDGKYNTEDHSIYLGTAIGSEWLI